jgi:prevent-host-death family protein
VRDILERVRVDREPIIVRTYGEPQAVLIPYEDFEEFQAWQARQAKREAWLAELRSIAEEVSARAALSQGEADVLISEAVREIKCS